jgi:hypothetical protein
MTLVKVISGGQTGVDIAALRAAKAVGLQTGGWMPRGYRTLVGPKPIYADLYGLQEHTSSSYPPRTHQNISDSDATLRIACDFDSAGERCTHQGIVKHRKPYMDVPYSPRFQTAIHISTMCSWILEKRIRILNVAGNSEFTTPGIEAVAEGYLIKLFRAVMVKP